MLKTNLEVSNNVFSELVNVGVKSTRNAVSVHTAEMDNVGVRVSQSGPKKAITLDLVLPTRRNQRGSRRVTKVELSGTQARQLYETLSKFYDERSTEESNTGVLWY